jgi:hypothetical protein
VVCLHTRLTTIGILKCFLEKRHLVYLKLICCSWVNRNEMPYNKAKRFCFILMHGLCLKCVLNRSLSSASVWPPLSYVNRSVSVMCDTFHLNTLRTGDPNLRFLRFCITTVKDEWRKSAFLTRAWFPRTSLRNTWSVSPNGPPGWMFKETWPHSELMIYEKFRGKNTRPQCVNVPFIFFYVFC